MTVELLRSLGTLADRPGPHQARLAELLGLPQPADPATHTTLFALELPPYASIYLGPEGAIGGEARDRVAGFLRALDITPPPEPDHLVALLWALAELTEAEQTAGPAARPRLHHARRVLFFEHVATWLPAYLDEAAVNAPAPYDHWARLLAAVVMAVAEELGPPPVDPPQQLRELATTLDPDADVDALVDWLLVPARAGIILTPGWLRQFAARAGVGVRIGDRRRALRDLLAAAPGETAAALADRARRAGRVHGARLSSLGAAAAHWRDQAAATADLLSSSADEGAAGQRRAVPLTGG